ncbi:MAG: 3-oxoacyl-[acyl-carrier-protein] synthase III C-terminal domain-containing protein [Desulfobacter sp.]
MEKSRFESIGACLPDKIVSTRDLLAKMSKPQNIDLEGLTGIKERHVRVDGEDSFTFAADAARNCISKSQYDAEDLDVIICTSITRIKDNVKFIDEPSMSYYIKKRVGATKAMHFDISNACAGMLTGCMILDNLIQSGMVKNGMVVSGEYNTSVAETALKEIDERIHPQFASLTVGDAGVAYIMDKSEAEDEGVDLIDLAAVAEYADLCMGLPSEKSKGLAMYTRTKEIQSNFRSRFPQFVDSVFQKNNRDFNPDAYDYIILHQMAERVTEANLNALEEHFGRFMPPALNSVEEYGNTSSTTLFLILHNKLKEGVIRPGMTILLISLASGIILGCLSLKIGDMKV